MWKASSEEQRSYRVRSGRSYTTMTRPIVELHYFQAYPKVWSPVLICRDFQSSLYLPAFIQKWQSAVGGHHGGLCHMSVLHTAAAV